MPSLALGTPPYAHAYIHINKNKSFFKTEYNGQLVTKNLKTEWLQLIAHPLGEVQRVGWLCLARVQRTCEPRINGLWLLSEVFDK